MSVCPETQRLPAIVFEKTRVRRLAWARWRTAMDRARQAREAARPRERKLLTDVFGMWRLATQRKSATRATCVFTSVASKLIGRRLRTRLRSTSGLDARRVVSVPIPLASPRFTTPRSNTPTGRSSLHRALDDTSARSEDSVVSEPAYSRLRSELRRRGGSDEPVMRRASNDGEADTHLLRALRAAVPPR